VTQRIAHLAESLDRCGSRPLYRQIEEGLQRLIESGCFDPAGRIPGDQELSALLRVNHRTVRHALAGLTAQGLIERRRRAGTFVTARAGRKRQSVGLFYYRGAEAWMARSIVFMQGRLDACGYDVKIIVSDLASHGRRDFLREARDRELVAAVIIPDGVPECLANLRRLEGAGFPYVRWGNQYFRGDLRAPLVCRDDGQTVAMALDYLRQRGHRQIGFVGPTQFTVAEEYRRCCRETGRFEDRWLLDPSMGVVSLDLRPILTESIGRQYLEANPDLTAVISYYLSDTSGLLAGAEALGRTVPDQLAILSLDGQTQFDEATPILRPFTVPFHTMGETVAELLVRLIGAGLPGEEEVIELESVPRPKSEPTRIGLVRAEFSRM